MNDLFGEGDLDIVFPNFNGSNEAWIQTEGVWTLKQQFASAITHDVALGDLDGDGDLDVFAANGQSDKVFLNNGAGIFTATGQTLSGLRGFNVALGDIDSDGDLDAFVANTDLGAEEVWINDGLANFTLWQSFSGANTNEVALGDLDGDGDLDAFVVNGHHDSIDCRSTTHAPKSVGHNTMLKIHFLAQK